MWSRNTGKRMSIVLVYQNCLRGSGSPRWYSKVTWGTLSSTRAPGKIHTTARGLDAALYLPCISSRKIGGIEASRGRQHYYLAGGLQAASKAIAFVG